MASEIASPIIVQSVPVPLGFSIALFIILFLAMVGFSTFLLWQAMRIFRRKGFGLKSAFTASIFSNIAQSAVFGVAFALLVARANPVIFSSRLVVSAVAIVEVLAVLAINLLAVKKACRFPLKEITHPVVLWTLLLMLVNWFAMPLIGNLIGGLLAKLW